MDSRTRVAVIGGGCAALSAAFELTRPEHRGRYQVTVYQTGFRLGGKGASGRGVAGRIEEHGLHLWMGFYENAFRLMRECYAELGRDPQSCPIADWRDAFTPAPLVGVTDQDPSGAWTPWVAHFPPGRGLPGDPMAEHDPFTVSGYLAQTVALLVELLRSAHSRGGGGTTAGAGPGRSASESVLDAIDRVLKYGQLATATALMEAAELFRAAILTLLPSTAGLAAPQAVLMRLLDAMAAAARRQIDLLLHTDVELRRVYFVVDLVLAVVRGVLRFGLLMDPCGFDAINDYDWREWLRLNGASEQSLDSGFLRGNYDLLFAFEQGDPQRPALAAGVALRGAMRMFFTYRGALFWRMQAGMGDIVFAPLYEVLKRRGVRFEFFHRLRNIKLADAKEVPPGDSAWVAALEFDVQAHVVGDREYQPLVPVHGLPCWPAGPDFAQLVDGRQLEKMGWVPEASWESRGVAKKTLRVVESFDFIVLGVGIGALPTVARELIARSPRWRVMVEQVKTVATQAFQIWLRTDMADLGWTRPPINLSGFVEPFDTWADMSHLIKAENWRQPPRAIAYFCNVLPDAPAAGSLDAQAAAAAHERVRQAAVRFLENDVVALWPKARDARGRFRWDVLAQEGKPPAGSRAPRGEARFDRQFWTANINPSDRYTLALPGSLKYRISPLDLTFDNLTIAGDWTATGLDSGCVESAVMSGLLAAHALSGFPRLQDIIGYDHP